MPPVHRAAPQIPSRPLPPLPLAVADAAVREVVIMAPRSQPAWVSVPQSDDVEAWKAEQERRILDAVRIEEERSAGVVWWLGQLEDWDLQELCREYASESESLHSPWWTSYLADDFVEPLTADGSGRSEAPLCDHLAWDLRHPHTIYEVSIEDYRRAGFPAEDFDDLIEKYDPRVSCLTIPWDNYPAFSLVIHQTRGIPPLRVAIAGWQGVGP